MPSSVRTLCAAALALGLVACGGIFSKGDTGPGFPPLDTGKGRVFVYRTSAIGASYSPDVLLNGEGLGRADRRGVAYRDVTPGSYTVATTLSARVVHFAVAAGESKYVRLEAGFFETQLHPELVDPARGASEVEGLGPFSPSKPSAKKK